VRLIFALLLLWPVYAEAAAELQTVEDAWLIIDSQPVEATTQTVEDAWLIVDSKPDVPGTTQTVEDAWLICDYSDPVARLKIRQN
jgi:hypothetical protein